MTKIAGNILELIGNTPLVKLNKLNGSKAEVLLKLESFNPMSSVKDRIGFALIEDAEKSGRLKKGGLIIEPTSGNTGIGLAMAAAVKGYKLILTMPETMSIERRKLLAALGAEIILTEGAKGMQGSIDKAQELHEANPGSIIPGQFTNPANPAYHYKVTAEEILRDTDNRIDFFVAGVGTGGTLTGIGTRLKEVNPDVKLIAVEPSDSPILSGGKAGPHKIQGIGANFIPKILNTAIIDEVMPVKAEDAGNTSRELARQEGILVGISSGAALFAALTVASRAENAGKRIVALMPDSGERYLSTWLFDDIK
ncbi:MAG TPA: cysteine synthase A [Lentisphaeria bacterium]|nr:cysteine synthase A [Lentisphaeria bacterium]HCG49989.1 cysteine synthase A [Lentisphaeria bacterium]